MSALGAEAASAAAPLPPAVDVATALELERPVARRRSAEARWELACLGVDAATLAAAGVASMVGAREGGLAWSFSPWTLAFCVLTAAFFQNRALYQLRIRIPVLDDVRRIVVALTFAAALVLSVRLVVAPSAAAADIVRPWLFGLVYVTAGRVALYWSQTKARVAGETVRQTVIVGAGRVGRVLARRLLAQPTFGLRPVGFVDPAPLLAGEDDELELPVLDDGRELESVLARYAVDHLIVTFSNERDDELLALVNRAEAVGVTVSIVPRLYEKLPERATIEHIGGLPLITAHATNPRGVSMAVKYALDRLAAAILIVLAAPFL